MAGELLALNELRTDILKALANLTRVCIVEKLKAGPLSVGELSAQLEEPPSLVSRHLGVMKKAGLVEDEKKGTTVVYSLVCDEIPDILDSVDAVLRRSAERYRSFIE